MKPTKKKIARKPKTEPWRAELARIVRFLNKNDEQSSLLWRVLAALRGPDDNNYDNKEASTCIIRAKTGLAPDLTMAIVVPKDSDEFASCRRNAIPSGHFKMHAKMAFEILGLKWDEVNK